MIKLVMCLCRHPDMTREQFQDYWLNNHGPFFQKHAGDMRAKKREREVLGWTRRRYNASHGICTAWIDR